MAYKLYTDIPEELKARVIKFYNTPENEIPTIRKKINYELSEGYIHKIVNRYLDHGKKNINKRGESLHR